MIRCPAGVGRGVAASSSPGRFLPKRGASTTSPPVTAHEHFKLLHPSLTLGWAGAIWSRPASRHEPHLQRSSCLPKPRACRRKVLWSTPFAPRAVADTTSHAVSPHRWRRDHETFFAPRHRRPLVFAIQQTHLIIHAITACSSSRRVLNLLVDLLYAVVDRGSATRGSSAMDVVTPGLVGRPPMTRSVTRSGAGAVRDWFGIAWRHDHVPAFFSLPPWVRWRTIAV